MGDVQDGEPGSLRQLAEQVDEVAAQRGVEHRRGLVGEDQPGTVHQSPGQGHALALAAGELVGVARPVPRVQVDRRERLTDPAIVLAFALLGFYLHHAATVRGLRRIVPRVDPAPAIVFEVDITSSSIDELALYAQFGVAEVWRHDGTAATILLPDADGYRQSDLSAAVPGLDAATLTRFLADGLTSPLPRWAGQVRAWAGTE